MSIKNVLHIIETLDRGGAELLFVDYINALPAIYRNIVVYLRPAHTLRTEIRNAEKVVCMYYNDKHDILRCALTLKKILKEHDINLVHAHLYWPTIVARLATGRRIPLVFSVHNLISEDAFKPNVLSKYAEKLTYSKKQYALFVSQAAYNDYTEHIKVSGFHKVLYNFIRPAFFEAAYHKVAFAAGELRLVSIGNLRVQKNHFFLIKALSKLKHMPISLVIYGEGPQRAELERYIEAEQVANVQLMGSVCQPELVLKNYDVFVSATRYEGFYIAMIEAMAVGLSCILPDLEVLKEVSGNGQVYYKSNNEDAFISSILMLYNNRHLLKSYATASVKSAAKYTLEAHIQQLTQVYTLALDGTDR